MTTKVHLFSQRGDQVPLNPLKAGVHLLFQTGLHPLKGLFQPNEASAVTGIRNMLILSKDKILSI